MNEIKSQRKLPDFLLKSKKKSKSTSISEPKPQIFSLKYQFDLVRQKARDFQKLLKDMDKTKFESQERWTYEQLQRCLKEIIGTECVYQLNQKYRKYKELDNKQQQLKMGQLTYLTKLWTGLVYNGKEQMEALDHYFYNSNEQIIKLQYTYHQILRYEKRTEEQQYKHIELKLI